MKRALLSILAAILCLASCQKNRDKIVAQVYYHKLYLSEIQANMPSGLSPEDSVAMVKVYIDSWVKEQLVLHEAEKTLSAKEKNFDKEMDNYRRSLLINAYYDKLVSDTSKFVITEQEIANFTRDFDKRYSVDKEIVRVNYVKMAGHSKLIAPVKAVLFNEERRTTQKEQLTILLGDSVEYMLDDNTWLYLDDVLAEIPFEIREDDLTRNHQLVEKSLNGYHYLLVVLDHKKRRAASETQEEKAAVHMMLANQRKRQFIENHVSKLYEQALKDGAVTQ